MNKLICSRKVGSIFRPVGASRLYHENVIDHYENPRNVGSLDKKKKNVGTGNKKTKPTIGNLWPISHYI